MYFTGYNRTLHRNVRHDGGKKRTFTRNYVINRRTRARCKGSIVMTSREQGLITKEHIATYTNLFLWFNPLNTRVL